MKCRCTLFEGVDYGRVVTEHGTKMITQSKETSTFVDITRQKLKQFNGKL